MDLIIGIAFFLVVFGLPVKIFFEAIEARQGCLFSLIYAFGAFIIIGLIVGILGELL